MADASGAREHGGSGLDFLQSHVPNAPKPWLDLSTGICPWPYPHEKPSGAVSRDLPPPTLSAACKTAACAYFGVPSANLALLPGSQAAISLLPRLFAPCLVSVLEPTYNEHAAAWRLGGHRVEPVENPSAISGDILVLTNPNNPDGCLIERDELLAISARRSREDKWTVVDEAFIDLIPSQSVADACDRSKLIVLRSFGKFFGLAGLRLGFAIAPHDLANQLEHFIGPWAVSGPALEIGAQAYRDTDWQVHNRKLLTTASSRQRALLSDAGLQETGGTDLFTLCEHDNAAGLFSHLCNKGIYVRRFGARPRQLRFGLTADNAAFERLAAALRDWAAR